MTHKKFLLGVLLSMAVCLSACYNHENEVTETTALTTSAVTEVTTAAETSETIMEESFEETTEEEEDSSEIPAALRYYESWVEIDMTDLSFVKATAAGLSDEQKSTVGFMRIENPADIESIKETAENFPNLKQIEINGMEYSSEISDEYFEALKNYSLAYSGQSPYYEKKDDRNNYTPKRGKNGETGFFIDPCVQPFNEDRNHDLELYFSNFTDKDVTAETLKIYRMNGDIPEAVPFADGSDIYNLNIELTTGEGHIYDNGDPDFIVTENIFPFSNHSNSRMRAEVIIDGKTFDIDFIITESAFEESSVPFLDEEQLAAFETAFDVADALEGCDNGIPDEYEGRPKEELIQWLCRGLTYDFACELADRNSEIFSEDGTVLYTEKSGGGRGSNITYCGNYFSPFYMSEDECIIRNTVVYWHGDSPYYSTFTDYNYRMVKTDDGWKFDNFKIWY